MSLVVWLHAGSKISFSGDICENSDRFNVFFKDLNYYVCDKTPSLQKSKIRANDLPGNQGNHDMWNLKSYFVDVFVA